MSDPLLVTLADGARLSVPNSLNLITTYVLQEQGDWFEDEIHFVRRALEPGDHAIDVGANYGLYTLALAQAVGPAGRVLAFEPASETAAHLARSLEANRLAHVTLARCALSRAPGEARLQLHGSSELNELVRDERFQGDSEVVAVQALDPMLGGEDWSRLAFLKMDAEGEEAAIVEGGRAFLTQTSPLVLIEIKAGARIDLGAAAQFRALGYDTYRLIPGLDLLAPYAEGDPLDGYQLNLFCAKPDRAERLAQRGLLVTREARAAVDPQGLEAAARAQAYAWPQALGGLPYADMLRPFWSRGGGAPHRDALEMALALFALSADPSQPAALRHAALEASAALLARLAAAGPLTRRASHARVARAFGRRAESVNALGALLAALEGAGSADLGEPFLAPCARFERVAPGEPARLGDWLMAAALEELEERASFSSFYSVEASAHRLAAIKRLGFEGEAMARRSALLLRRHGL